MNAHCDLFLRLFIILLVLIAVWSIYSAFQHKIFFCFSILQDLPVYRYEMYFIQAICLLICVIILFTYIRIDQSEHTPSNLAQVPLSRTTSGFAQCMFKYWFWRYVFTIKNLYSSYELIQLMTLFQHCWINSISISNN